MASLAALVGACWLVSLVCTAVIAYRQGYHVGFYERSQMYLSDRSIRRITEEHHEW